MWPLANPWFTLGATGVVDAACGDLDRRYVWIGRAQLAHLRAKGDSPITFLCWSGTLATGLFDDDPRNWMRAGRDALTQLINSLLPIARESGAQIGLVPHHRHILSDFLGQLRISREHEGSSLITILSPATLIAPSMGKDLTDHVTRSIAVIAPSAATVILEDIQLDPNDPMISPARCRWGTGSLPHEILLQALGATLTANIPILLPEPNLNS